MTEKALSTDERHLAEIAALRRDADAAESAWEEARSVAKAKKEIHEAMVGKLFAYLRALDQPLPLFDAWRQTPVAELGLPDSIVMLLEEHGLDTVGKLADWTQTKQLTDIPHVGEQKAEAIRQAMERFWREHPQPADGEVGNG